MGELYKDELPAGELRPLANNLGGISSRVSGGGSSGLGNDSALDCLSGNGNSVLSM